MMKKVRIFFNWIRGYEFGDPSRNGGYRFLRSYLKGGMVIFDVGANVGDFTGQALSLENGLEVHCFEPVKSRKSPFAIGIIPGEQVRWGAWLGNFSKKIVIAADIVRFEPTSSWRAKGLLPSQWELL